MEQRDYIEKEIAKIGAIMSAIRQRIFGGKENLAIVLEEQKEDAKGMLFDGADFDLDHFLSLNAADAEKYIHSFVGFNVHNIELLADNLSQLGLNDKSADSKKYFEKALQLYKLCDTKSKTYSLDREQKMQEIEKNQLK